MPHRLPYAYRALFMAFDANRDGLLSVVDVRDGLARLGAPMHMLEVAGLIAQHDDDGDGHIGPDEFATMLDAAHRAAHDGQGHEELARSFQAFDGDGDGHLTVDEVAALFRLAGVEAEEQVAAWIAELDDDGDGRVSLAEFVSGQQA